MDQKMNMEELLLRPAFSVENGRITRINREAGKYFLEEGMPIGPLIAAGQEEYESFQAGVLSLTLCIQGQNVAASVQHTGQGQLFILEQEQQDAYLQSMALAAQELRGPLAGMMATIERSENSDSQLNRRMYQMLRIIGNMSDAGRYRAGQGAVLEIRDVTMLMQEIFDRSSDLISHAGLTLTFQNLNAPVDCLVDSEKLERAVLNILSNAIKFTPKGGTIDCSLTKKGNLLVLQVQDSGSGIPDAIRGNIHSRYQRQPGIEDGRFGIGLGMVLIRSAASIHGGTVLIDQPEGSGTRITMTMAIRKNPSGNLRSNVLRVDYSGERDHGLVELSESLPAFLYEQN